MSINTVAAAIIANIVRICVDAPYSTAEATEAFRFQVRELLKELDALIESGEVYSYQTEVREAREAAGLFLGTHERYFTRYECKGCNTSSYNKEDRFCFKCGKECERKEQVSKKYEPEVSTTKCEVVRMACSCCGEKIYMEKGAEIHFHSIDGGRYERLQAEVDGEAFAAQVGLAWKVTLGLLAKEGGNDRATMMVAFEEVAKFILEELFTQMGPRFPLMIEGLKARAGSVLSGVRYYIQGTEMLAQGLVRAQDAKKMIPKIHGWHEKLAKVSAMMPQVIEAMLSSQDPEHLARCFAQGAMLGLQMNCGIKTIMGVKGDPMVACLEEAIEVGFDWAGLYVALQELATWAEAKHL